MYPPLENSTTLIAIGGYHGGHYKKSYYKRNRYGRSVSDDPNADREFSDIQEGDLQVHISTKYKQGRNHEKKLGEAKPMVGHNLPP